MTLALSF